MSVVGGYSPESFQSEIRVSCVSEPTKFGITGPAKIASYWRRVIRNSPWHSSDREIAVVVCLNTKHKVIGHGLVSVGTLNSAIVHCRDVFRYAIAVNAYKIALVHNHPSGSPLPSAADIRLTQRISEAGELLQIPLVDHIIIGHGRIWSFKSDGCIRSRGTRP
jgi:DNA repair protein RadC